MFAVAIAAGVVIGLSLGALGGGGSILTVPALVYLLGQSAHAATTGSLLIVGVTALAGTAAHRCAGRVRLGAGVVFGLLGVAGSYVGSRLSASVRPSVLLTAFAALMLVAAAAMLRRARKGTRDSAALSANPPGPRRSMAAHVHSAVASLKRGAITSTLERLDVRRAMKVLGAATVVGLLTGFFGVGGGFVIVPALVLALGFDMPVAVGTSLLVIAINSAVALAARASTPTHLDWPLIGLFTLAAILGSFAGSRIASRVDAAKLTVAFVVLLVAVAAYTAAQSIPQIV